MTTNDHEQRARDLGHQLRDCNPEGDVAQQAIASALAEAEARGRTQGAEDMRARAAAACRLSASAVEVGEDDARGAGGVEAVEAIGNYIANLPLIECCACDGHAECEHTCAQRDAVPAPGDVYEGPGPTRWVLAAIEPVDGRTLWWFNDEDGRPGVCGAPQDFADWHRIPRRGAP